jgi:creatinine amidohydrolase/Fe(II)-dependent formamide hydrolase-like protein
MCANHPLSKQYTGSRTLVLLPVGSYEQHGPHLPVDTDLHIAQLLAERLIKTFSKEAILLPAIPFSCSWEHKGQGTIAINTSTISALLYDIAQSLKSWGIPVFLVLLNWHGGNSILASLTTEITAREGIPTTVIQALSLGSKVWNAEDPILFPDVHAGMIETSIMQAYWPELVARFDDLDFVPDTDPAEPQSVFQALGIYAISKTGVWGKPQKSDAEKGRVVIDAVVKTVHGQITKLLQLIEEHSVEGGE